MSSLLAQVQALDIEGLGRATIIMFVVSILIVFAIMIALLWVGWWVTSRRGSVSPYSGQPMKFGEDLAFSAAERVNRFMNRFEDKENPAVDLRWAAICGETGRIFPSCVNRWGVVRLKWDFLRKRHPGNWVSWGSLDLVTQSDIARYHESMEGFQTQHNSPKRMPQDVDAYFANIKPGPLYVDIGTKMLMGWKCVPGTNLEVLIVQKPDLEKDRFWD